eukprot:TRINITY_DN19451_c0_g1_i1.p1 TRINITY_DN19451_c0_g1~~TRINITY_DN19451_c0_g1_i1.p1  ORF type:complete len:261 (+),score=22.48 TRINITY_DN19451_c0_g1_i1:66-848(+)
MTFLQYLSFITLLFLCIACSVDGSRSPSRFRENSNQNRMITKRGTCGDGIVDPGEECDTGAVNDTSCVNCQIFCSQDWQCHPTDENKFMCDLSTRKCVCNYGFIAPNCTCPPPGFISWEGPQGNQQPYCLHPPECTQPWQCETQLCVKKRSYDILGTCFVVPSTTTKPTSASQASSSQNRTTTGQSTTNNPTDVKANPSTTSNGSSNDSPNGSVNNVPSASGDDTTSDLWGTKWTPASGSTMCNFSWILLSITSMILTLK